MIIPLTAFKDNYIWAIVNEVQRTFSCVDPGEALPVLTYADKNGFKLSAILLTHHHFDHIGGVEELKAAFPRCHIYAPWDERIPFADYWLKDEDLITIADHDFRILKTPGHTRSHICYQEMSKGWLFCGDTLFSAGCGRVFDGTLEQLHRSLQLLKNLPKDTQVYCGHEYTAHNLAFAAMVEPENAFIASYRQLIQKNDQACTLPSTIGIEKQINPFMRTTEPSLKAYAQKAGLENTDSLTIFSLLRQQKDIF